MALKSAAHLTRLPSLDLDVLVPEERLTEVTEYLHGRGFQGTRGQVEDLELTGSIYRDGPVPGK